MDADFGSSVGAGKAVGQRRDSLLPDERPTRRVVVEDGDRRGKLVENIRALPIRVERHVARSGARSDRRKRDRVRAEQTRAQIEIQRIDLVSAQVDAEHMTPAEISEDLMRMRTLLAVRAGPGSIADTLELVSHGAD